MQTRLHSSNSASSAGRFGPPKLPRVWVTFLGNHYRSQRKYLPVQSFRRLKMSTLREEHWNVLALQIANENVPARLSELVKKLVDEKDRVDEKAPTTKSESH